MKISEKTLRVLALVLTGEHEVQLEIVDGINIYYIYKSGPDLVEMFNEVGFKDEYNNGLPGNLSRRNYCEERLRAVNDTDSLKPIIESYLNPINFIEYPHLKEKIIEKLNQYLVFDGYRLDARPKSTKIIEIEEEIIELENIGEIAHDQARESIEKCRKKISDGDYDGAISISRTLLESVFGDIYEKSTGQKMPKSGDLLIDYKKIKDILNLSEEQYSNESLKSIIRGLSNIVGGIDSISNSMGDRHRRVANPLKHHAKLCVNSVSSLVDFFYDTLQYQTANLQSLYDEFVSLLDSNIRLLSPQELVENQDVQGFTSKLDKLQRKILKDLIVREYEIVSFRTSDIYFSSLTILLQELSDDDINIIFEKQYKNGQAIGLESFLNFMQAERPGIIQNSKILKYLSEKKVNCDDKGDGKDRIPF